MRTTARRTALPHRTQRMGLAVLTLLLFSPVRAARALDVPNIDGHMTDPGQTLGKGDKTAIEDKLGKVQQDTRVDVAGWILDAPESSLDKLGREAFKRWHIGGDWDNAVFFVIPRVGRAHVILDDSKPELTVPEVERVVGADKPGAPMPQRVDLVADTAAEIVRAKALRARPNGVSDPGRGRRFLLAFAVVVLLAGGLSYRAKRKERAST
jgi:hypothetical protein